MKKLSLAMLMATCVLVPNISVAEDIEIYVGTDSYRQGANPKVMIIFDNSGSMRIDEEIKVAYDPTRIYPRPSGSPAAFNESAIYFNRGAAVDFGAGLVPDGHNDSRRFNTTLLGCETAWEKLNTVGYYTGYLREYNTKGNSGAWEPFPGEMGMNKANPVDCFDDIVQQKGGNGTFKDGNRIVEVPDGHYPINGSGRLSRNNIEAAYTSNWDLALSQSSLMQDSQPVTLYTTNYLRYYHSTAAEIGTENKSRLEVAKETINELLTSTPGVDFGMMLFNLNWLNEGSRDGGRIVSGIKKMTDANRTALLNTVSDINANTNTPLCESLMETKRYLAGEAVDYGKKDSNVSNWYIANQPPRDTSIESGNNYITPYDVCSDVVYIILITDGEPTVDNHADNAIKALPGVGAPYTFANGRVNYLPALAEWMFKNDVNTELSGMQTARL
ncbi:MAG TPA: rRNA (guanine-N1)-methyltransferase, partial [Shewanella frigidimarina]|nr:rRNA (guanine-N1)-methyltransferase [Shewanella frigidimarina]